MSNGQPKRSKRSSLRERKFYQMDFYRTGDAIRCQITDNSHVRLGLGHLSNFTGPTPRITLDRKSRRPRDCEGWYGLWLISDRAKSVFEAVDPEAFSFLACDVDVQNGVWDGPRYWFCDVRRFLDAVDEERSKLEIGISDDPAARDFGQKCYDFFGDVELVFKEELVGDAHVFRMAHAELRIICDQVLKDAWKSAGLRGVLFEDASYLPMLTLPRRRKASPSR
ncbi:DUF1629 domain-containing protein [uncultured Bradyrhizobium sp.]|uniref:imm11 family protein n=1 Tax=uncultured Bradyrhizobium sp. TaxID=199684 RepID=UPI00345BEC99